LEELRDSELYRSALRDVQKIAESA
jgi:hypothetical protein